MQLEKEQIVSILSLTCQDGEVVEKKEGAPEITYSVWSHSRGEKPRCVASYYFSKKSAQKLARQFPPNMHPDERAWISKDGSMKPIGKIYYGDSKMQSNRKDLPPLPPIEEMDWSVK